MSNHASYLAIVGFVAATASCGAASADANHTPFVEASSATQQELGVVRWWTSELPSEAVVEGHDASDNVVVAFRHSVESGARGQRTASFSLRVGNRSAGMRVRIGESAERAGAYDLERDRAGDWAACDRALQLLGSDLSGGAASPAGAINTQHLEATTEIHPNSPLVGAPGGPLVTADPRGMLHCSGSLSTNAARECAGDRMQECLDVLDAACAQASCESGYRPIVILQSPAEGDEHAKATYFCQAVDW